MSEFNYLDAGLGLNTATQNLGNRPRERLGSWSGPNESDDELEALVMDPEAHSSSSVLTPNASGSNASRSTLEDRMRRKIRFFFMNPIEKWQAKRRFPYKFVVQVIKIILVTIQLCLFAHSRYTHVNYTWDNRIAFSHLFLKGWDSTREVNAYPPATGPLAVYQIDEYFNTIDYAFSGYANLSNAIGPYSYTKEDNSMPFPTLCLYQYKEGSIFGFNESFVFNSEIDKLCVNLTLEGNQTAAQFSSKKYLEKNKIVIEFSALVQSTLSFSLKTVNFKAAGPITPPDCYKFNIQIMFDNTDHDGQMLLSLEADPIRLYCKGDTEYITDNRIDSILRSLLNFFVITICGISLLLCGRAIYRAQVLKRETVAFFKNTYGKDLGADSRMEFLNMWYIMIIANDILIIMGSAIKQQIEKKQFAGDQWNICSVLLGTGNLLVWFGVLRYLGFFKTYNVVILTLKKATPKVSRFLLCALLIYAGFTFCGWLVLGPYHMKFRSLASTSECLFALINGDDMYATFSIMSFKSPMLWWYSRIYLYSFISLYIYVVLSLFISVIMDAYETIKLYYKTGFPKNELLDFVSSCTDEASSGIYRSESNGSLVEMVDRLCCCKKPHSPEPAQSAEEPAQSAEEPAQSAEEPENMIRITVEASYQDGRTVVSARPLSPMPACWADLSPAETSDACLIAARNCLRELVPSSSSSGDENVRSASSQEEILDDNCEDLEAEEAADIGSPD